MYFYTLYRVIILFIVCNVYAKEIRISKLNLIDQVMQTAIPEHIPGAVIAVGNKDTVVYLKAFGNIAPLLSQTTADGVYDIASLTKPITALAIMRLVEQGKIRLTAPVCMYLPELYHADKNLITIEQLLLHSSGLPPILELSGKDNLLTQINNIPLQGKPGAQFIYSDVGYMILGNLIERCSRMSLGDFFKRYLFDHLDMQHTCFNPAYEKNHIAPTGWRNDILIQGVVHDPRAYVIGGVAGHAGLFSTVSDLAKLCTMMLNRGIYNGNSIISPMSIDRMRHMHHLPDGTIRGLGWDIQTHLSTCIGDLFSKETIAHTGFTGTSLVIDMLNQTYLIILTNRTLTSDSPTYIRELRACLANIVASAIY